MAAATAGSVIGHTIAHGILGLGSQVTKGSEEATPAAEAAPAAAAAPAPAPTPTAQDFMVENRNNPCFSHWQALQRCLDNNDHSMDKCQWALDLMKECKMMHRV
jgi:hypothetical protein